MTAYKDLAPHIWLKKKAAGMPYLSCHHYLLGEKIWATFLENPVLYVLLQVTEISLELEHILQNSSEKISLKISV